MPDPAEIAEFDFGLDDPFNQRSKGSKSLLRKRVDAARVDGRLNIAAMGLSEMPEEVMEMYKYDPNDTTIAWGEVVDLTTIIAADNRFESLPDTMFPDVDMESAIEADDPGPQFGAIQNLDLHGNLLPQLPLGMRRLTQLSKLNLVSVLKHLYLVISANAHIVEEQINPGGLGCHLPDHFATRAEASREWFSRSRPSKSR